MIITMLAMMAGIVLLTILCAIIAAMLGVAGGLITLIFKLAMWATPLALGILLIYIFTR